jgi:DNA-binding CsgD family transcriptional regulator
VAWAEVDTLVDRIDDSDTLVRARVLRAATRCAMAAGDSVRAHAAALELAMIAERVATPALAAQAAEAAAIVAEPPLAAVCWRRAVALFHEAGLPFDEAEARLALAACAPLTQTEARAHFEAAARTLAVLGAARPARRLSGEPGDRGDSGHRLSPREREVLRLVAAGMTNGEISEILVVSVHTVHRHIANILTKLDAPTRAAAVSSAARSGEL